MKEFRELGTGHQVLIAVLTLVAVTNMAFSIWSLAVGLLA